MGRLSLNLVLIVFTAMTVATRSPGQGGETIPPPASASPVDGATAKPEIIGPNASEILGWLEADRAAAKQSLVFNGFGLRYDRRTPPPSQEQVIAAVKRASETPSKANTEYAALMTNYLAKGYYFIPTTLYLIDSDRWRINTEPTPSSFHDTIYTPDGSWGATELGIRLFANEATANLKYVGFDPAAIANEFKKNVPAIFYGAMAFVPKYQIISVQAWENRFVARLQLATAANIASAAEIQGFRDNEASRWQIESLTFLKTAVPGPFDGYSVKFGQLVDDSIAKMPLYRWVSVHDPRRVPVLHIAGVRAIPLPDGGENEVLRRPNSPTEISLRPSLSGRTEIIDVTQQTRTVYVDGIRQHRSQILLETSPDTESSRMKILGWITLGGAVLAGIVLWMRRHAV